MKKELALIQNHFIQNSTVPKIKSFYLDRDAPIQYVYINSFFPLKQAQELETVLLIFMFVLNFSSNHLFISSDGFLLLF